MRSYTVKWDKLIGYSLISIGLGMILISIYLMYAVFTNSMEPPKILTLNDVKLLIYPIAGGPPIETTLLQGNQFSKRVNMLLWAIFMLVIISAGGKVSDIGIKLVKEVKS
jgi:hypothetical protein